ncbi:Hypothetical_protein [Hexamita inflata]|uniref:Hypothetical_protein n=1 Tax=Hexamita inflata TaxID=28002 RepID=A0AA86RGM4_9EUKA|nr:Hypothetical protein HINF_LOCUS65794 [Hexamita inflata]
MRKLQQSEIVCSIPIWNTSNFLSLISKSLVITDFENNVSHEFPIEIEFEGKVDAQTVVADGDVFFYVNKKLYFLDFPNVVEVGIPIKGQIFNMGNKLCIASAVQTYVLQHEFVKTYHLEADIVFNSLDKCFKIFNNVLYEMKETGFQKIGRVGDLLHVQHGAAVFSDLCVDLINNKIINSTFEPKTVGSNFGVTLNEEQLKILGISSEIIQSAYVKQMIKQFDVNPKLRTQFEKIASECLLQKVNVMSNDQETVMMLDAKLTKIEKRVTEGFNRADRSIGILQAEIQMTQELNKQLLAALKVIAEK